MLHVNVEHIMTCQSLAIPKTFDESGRRINTSARGGVDYHCWMVNALTVDEDGSDAKVRTVIIASNTLDLMGIPEVIE